MSGTLVTSPLPGRVVALRDVPDLVFAQEMVGPGLAIDPRQTSGTAQVHSPLAGRVGALHPHAFAIDSGTAQVLVHLGLDTVTLEGEPFEVLIAPEDDVSEGQVVIRWRIAEIGALSPLVPIVALGATEVQVLAEPGTEVEVGTPLYRITQ